MVRDLYGRQLKPGDHIVLKNIEALPFVVKEISEAILQRTPQGMVPLQTVQIIAMIPVTVVGDNGTMIAAFRVRESEEDGNKVFE